MPAEKHCRRTSRLSPAVACIWASLLLLMLNGCSIRQIAVNALADSLAEGSDIFSSDEDPELIRDALPFSLKTLEVLLAESPDNAKLLVAACSGFAQYGYGFVALEAERLEASSYRQAVRQAERALKLVLRGRDYCFRALDLTLADASAGLLRGAGDALAGTDRDDVELLYWTAASWGAAISLGLDRPELVVDLPAVRALLEKALELDADFDHGALHETMISIAGLPETMGGSLEEARRHYQRALELNGGRRASTYLNWAETVSVRQQDREEFMTLLDRALAVDADAVPSERLINLLAQDRARLLLSRADELFLEDLDEP